MRSRTIRDFLFSDDPLSEFAMRLLLAHKEEDTLVDYKETFDPKIEKEWLAITIDSMAFANTMGGYLVFGVKDISFEPVGLAEQSTRALSDTNLVLQKLNRFIAPAFTRIRTKRFARDGKDFVIFHIPESVGQTHIVVKEAAFSYPSGERKIFLRPGMIFIRRSASNHVVTPDDFDFIIRRRIDHYKASILDKIARVVEAPPEHEVLVFNPQSQSEDAKTFVISDAPEAIPIKGMGFTVAPETDEQEIASWIALGAKDPDFLPRPQQLWRLYSKRHGLKLSISQISRMAQFSLLTGVPGFYWLQTVDAELIKSILLEAAAKKCSISEKECIVHTGAFLGKGFYTELFRKLGKLADRFDKRSRVFPEAGPRDFFGPRFIEGRRKIAIKITEEKFRESLETDLSKLSSDMSEARGGVMERRIAQSFDCYLYARDDKYQKKKPLIGHDKKTL